MYPEIDWAKEPDLEGVRNAFRLMEVDFSGAEMKLEALAASGSIASMFYLADAYALGRFQHQRDLETAKKWYAEAENHGWRPGSFILGRILFDQGLHKEAFLAFQRSAAVIYIPGVFWYGLCKVKGIGTSVDEHEGIRHIEVAAYQGHLLARRKLIGIYLSGKFGPSKFLAGLLFIPILFGQMLKVIVRGEWREHSFEDRIM
uniref:Sel1 repeat family protein n=1 Tax=Rhizobium rhizogenes TaxID=359 RepID=A0A7S4ZT07_RHIRH|nr:sel1 repeat family protein [Rhizobium rhizogenes]QCL10056.1 sel1 repeat family protein [Rhizobium rhizogenes]